MSWLHFKMTYPEVSRSGLLEYEWSYTDLVAHKVVVEKNKT